MLIEMMVSILITITTSVIAGVLVYLHICKWLDRKMRLKSKYAQEKPEEATFGFLCHVIHDSVNTSIILQY